MTAPAATWTRTVDCNADRRAALRDALAELPAGPIWDVVIRHCDGCPSLEDWGELADCTCSALQLEAQELR